MIENLSGIAYGLITFALIIGIGLVVFQNFKGSVAQCPSGYYYNRTLDLCVNSSDASMTTSASGQAYTSTGNLISYIGTGNGGLVLWVPAIIALLIGVMFLWLLGNRGRKI